MASLAEAYLYGFSVVFWATGKENSFVRLVFKLPQQTIVQAPLEENWPTHFIQRTDDGVITPINEAKTAYAVKETPPYGDGLYLNIATQGLQFLQNSTLLAASTKDNLQNLPNWDIPKRRGT